MIRRTLQVYVLYLSGMASALAADAGPGHGAPVTVRTKDGQVMRGQVDASTTSDHLALRWTEPGIVLLSRPRWDEIDRVWYRGQWWTSREFLPVAEAIRTEAPREVPPPPPGDRPAGVDAPERRGAQPGPTGSRERTGRRKVAFLDIQAAVANWDTDVPADGLALRVLPRDSHGNLVPVRGNVTAVLWGQRTGQVRPARIFRPLGRWCQRLSAADFGVDGAQLRLAYQAVRPEQDRPYRPEALLHVTLGVPGQGNVEASVPVWLEPVNPFRDQLELLKHRRFLPRERTGYR